MTSTSVNEHHTPHHHEEKVASKVTFGFWVYLMTDAILFAGMFATYAVLHNNTYGGPGIAQVATLDHILIQTLILIVSTFTYGLSFIALHRGRNSQLVLWLLVTFLLGLAFVGIEIKDCTSIVQSGYTWQTSAFLSAYFMILSIHAIHITVGLVWMVILLIQLSMQDMTTMMKTRFTCLSLFWNFITLMWLIIFSLIFLMGAI